MALKIKGHDEGNETVRFKDSMSIAKCHDNVRLIEVVR
jgi:hypothetical protein